MKLDKKKYLKKTVMVTASTMLAMNSVLASPLLWNVSAAEETRVTQESKIARESILKATAKSLGPGTTIENSLDGNPSTYTDSDYNNAGADQLGGMPQVYTFELSEAKQLSKVKILPRQNSQNGRVASYEVLVSTDGSVYTSVKTGNADPTGTAWIEILLDTPIEAKFVQLKLRATEENFNSFHVVTTAEVELYEQKTVEEETVTISSKINGNAVSGKSLADMVAKSGLTIEDITSLELTEGVVTQKDLAYLKELSYLESFTMNLSDTLRLEAKDGSYTTALGEGEKQAQIVFAPKRSGSSKGDIVNVRMEGVREVYKNGIKSDSIEELYLPDVVTVGDDAFSTTFPWLETVDLSNAKVIGKRAFSDCRRLESLTLKKVETLQEGSFEYTDALTKLTLPETLKTIEDIRFGIVRSGNKSGTKITLQCTTPPNVANGAFKGVSSVTRPSVFIIPHGSLEAYSGNSGDKYMKRTATSWNNLFLREEGSYHIEYCNTKYATNYFSAYVPHGEAVGAARIPMPTETEEGKVFKEWNTKKDGTGKAITAETVLTEDVSVYPIFEDKAAEKVQVTFKDRKGDTLQSLEVEKGKGLSLEQIPVVEDEFEGNHLEYLFRGWKGPKDTVGISAEDLIKKYSKLDSDIEFEADMVNTNDVAVVKVKYDSGIYTIPSSQLPTPDYWGTQFFTLPGRTFTLADGISLNENDKDFKGASFMHWRSSAGWTAKPGESVKITNTPKLLYIYPVFGQNFIYDTGTEQKQTMYEVNYKTKVEKEWLPDLSDTDDAEFLGWEINGKIYETKEAVEAAEIPFRLETKATAVWKKIDKSAPKVEVSYSNKNGSQITAKDVVVTLTANEAIQDIEGWTREADNVLTKTFDKNGKHSVIVTDLAGNATDVNFEVKNIDKIVPVIVGVEEGVYYASDVTYAIEEQNIDKIYVDGVAYDEEQAPRTITAEGQHTIRVVDKAGNEVSVTFVIDKTKPVVEVFDEKGNTVGSTYEMTLHVGDEYIEYGAYVKDNLDGEHKLSDPTAIYFVGADGKEIAVDAVDTSKVGEYRLEYQFSDQAGNQQTATRIVKIIEADVPVDPQEPSDPNEPNKPIKPVDPVKPQKPEAPKDEINTGDVTNIAGILVLLLVSGVGLVVLRKKSRQ